MSTTAAASSAVRVRRPELLLVGVVLVLAVPRILAGPGLMADDWVWVRNGEFLGWWDAGGSRQAGRPGAYLLYAIIFGLGGAHPLVHAAIQVGLWTVAAVAVHGALRRLIGDRPALACTLVWLVAPSHLTLELWASTSQAWIAITTLAVGARLLVDDGAARRRWGWLLLALSGTFYEVAIPVVPVVAVVASRVRTGRWRPADLAAGVAVGLPAAVWSVTAASLYDAGVQTTEGRWVQHLAGALGLGIRVERDSVAALVVLAAVGAAVALTWRHVRGLATRSEGWALVGLSVAVAAALPGLRSFTIPVGIGDRLTAVSGVGAAVFWVGALSSVVTRLRPAWRRGAAVALAGLAALARIDAYAEWIDLEDRTAGMAAGIAERVAADDVMVVDGPLLDDERYYGFYDGWNTTAAVQVVAGDPSVVVQVDIRCFRTGPAADDPLEQYGDRGEPRVPECHR